MMGKQKNKENSLIMEYPLVKSLKLFMNTFNIMEEMLKL